MYNLLREYEQILIGRQDTISNKFFPFDEAVNEKFALTVFRYAIEILLRWSPRDAYRLFTPVIVKKMKLTPLLDYIRFPSDITNAHTDYIIHLLYPRNIPFDFTRYVLETYEKVMCGKIKYPKDYMFGGKGLKRATICLQYALKKEHIFSSVEEMYQYFASAEAVEFLKRNKLYQLYYSFYHSPLEFLHNSLPETVRNHLYYDWYRFVFYYRKHFGTAPP